jgi:hypothetical protein
VFGIGNFIQWVLGKTVGGLILFETGQNLQEKRIIKISAFH